MRLCFLTSSYPRFAGDGAGSFVASLAAEAVRQGHSVEVVAPYDPAIAPRSEPDGLVVHRFRYAPSGGLCLAGHARSLQADIRLRWVVPLLMPGFCLAMLSAVTRLHREAPFDLLHAHWVVPAGFVGALVARHLGVPLVISLHGSDVYVIERHPLYARAARHAFGRAGHVIACSGDLRDRARRRGLSPSASSVIPYGVDAERYARGDGEAMRRRLGLGSDALVIGALGRLVHKKGFRYLLEALPPLLGAMPEARCVIGGDGDLREELESSAASLDVSDRVLFTGHVDWQETPDFYRMCDVVAVPSVVDDLGNVDGLPNVVLEAMASGRCVVASRVGGIPSVLEDGRTGILVEPGDPAALGAALGRVVRDVDLRARLGESARAHVAERLQWSAVFDRHLAVYYGVAARPGA